MSRTTLKTLLAVVLPPVLIAALGIVHPQHLTLDASLFWRNLHVVLLPLFPLLALGPWLVARSIDAKFGRIALLLGFVEEHVYWPGGVLSMVALAAGWALLVRAQRYGDEHA